MREPRRVIWKFGRAIALLAAAVLNEPPAHACLADFTVDAGNPTGFTLFPNWTRAKVSQFDLIYCDSATCPWGFDGSLVGLTVLNYGSATGGAGGDLANLYFCGGCGAACAAPTQTMTYAGMWTVQGVPYPAWTWNSGGAPLVFNSDPCNAKGGCVPACTVILSFWVDVGPCPTDGATIALGPAYNSLLVPPGGVSDQYGCTQPWTNVQDPSPKRIAYVHKEADKARAAPGDTVSYTIYYGRPGTAPLTQFTVVDSLPPYTTYLPGTASPAPDPGWDPDVGPPTRLRWTLPGGATTGGPTGRITFQATVDWGNQPWEPASGPAGAPEGQRLQNRAQVFFEGTTCASTSAVSPTADTVVRRFLFWQEADNDILFSYALGQPNDEITYTTVIKNVSTSKTWWRVTIWDTVPPELDSWCVNCGMEDPCLGWTMTPSGCAAANAGKLLSGSNTVLTWRLDLAPQQTLQIRWKAQVRPSAPSGGTAVGYNGVGGTGDSQVPANFAHLAPLFLPTTYISYTSFFGADKGNTACPGHFIPFWPLNKKTDFTLYGLEVSGPGTWAQLGGVSPPISNFIGTCTGGFPGYSPGGTAGCKIERAPAMYQPTAWLGVCPTFPYHFIYKVVANSPILWQMRTRTLNDNQDHHLYDPTSTISFRGFIAYSYRLKAAAGGTGLGSALTVINTSTDATFTYRPALATAVHMFRWDPVALGYAYQSTMELDAESAGVIAMGTTAAEEGFYRFLSSDANIILHHAYNTFDTLTAAGCCDNYSTMAPTRETGNVVSKTNAGNFYAVGEPWGAPGAGATWTAFVVGNTGTTDATYRIWRYQPTGTSPAPVPSGLGGTSGRWLLQATDSVAAGQGLGLTNPPNPHAYSGCYDRFGFTGPSTGLFKVELLSGGPIQVQTGNFLPSVFAGGAVLHAADGNQVGLRFWFHETGSQNYNCGGGADPPMSPLGTLDIFCPKQGMTVRNTANDGYSAIYTTTSADQVVAFHNLTFINSCAAKRTWVMDITGTGAIALYQQCTASEKGYTSPFVQTGVHYLIVAPPVVFSGQSFWITVVVVDQGNNTKTDYCGTTSFTSTDPAALIEGTAMDAYNYAWDSNDPAASCKGAGCVGACDNGVRVLVNVTLVKLGQHAIVASDILDGTITGFASITVVGVDIKFTKEPPLTVAASGDTVRFRICWSNYSDASALAFTITDAVPQGTDFVPEASTAGLSCGNTKGVAPVVAYSASTSPTPPSSWTDGNPPGGTTRWLRWTVPQVGVNTTGCVCFRVRVQ
jgi:uncharacterized repeat protein (TIGR01451 family)